MRENSLLLIMDLFALIGKSDSPYRIPRRKMEELFLKQTIKDDHIDTYLNRHDKILAEKLSLTERKQKIIAICHELNAALTKRHRANAALRIMEYTLLAMPYDQDEYDTLKMLSGELKLSKDEFLLMQGFIESSALFKGPDALVISSQQESQTKDRKHILRTQLEGAIHIIYLQSADMYFSRYEGLHGVQLNGVQMKNRSIHVVSPGAIIRGELIKPVYYSDIVSCFRQHDAKHSLDFKVDKVTYNFPDGPVGLHELSFTEYTGQLMGIMGGSGSGKSTLLNVLNGSIRPTTGKITVNGIDLYDQADELKGVVGFVSQDDLLIENLTVYQNLYFNAQLCFSGKDDDFIREKVEKVSLDLGLNKIRHLKVGNPLEKIISGGQRKRLNIALELIREPAVLFLDEPTSGLSSKDSEVIIDLLKSLALRGTLVFMVIHQPSSQIFKVFDKLLLLDQGGYPVYFGNPVDSVIYFKHATHQINPDMGECVCCGNVNSEQIFSIMEVRELDESGFPTGERKFSPKQWNEHFKEQQALQEPTIPKIEGDFVNDYRKPGLLKQFSVFVKRDVLAKLNNKQYLFITLLEAPVLAFLLAFLTRYRVPGNEYAFQDNRNFVSYIFMSVIVALFLGMMVSAEEILSDRKIRKRERFLNLSRVAYLSSKFAILMGIAAIQAFLFVIVGNMIMGMREHYFEYWLMFFVLMLYANALGLNVSSAFRSAVTIYILIPFLIIPQLMLSGLLVKFNELNPVLAARSVVPVSGDLMATRWAFEGLAVKLYTENDYKRRFYDLDKQKMNLLYYKTSWFYKMSDIIKATNASTADSLLPIIKTEFENVGLGRKYSTLETVENGQSMNALLAIRKTYNDKYDQVLETLDNLFLHTNADGTKQDWDKLRSLYFNDRLEDLVTNHDQLTEKIYFENGALHPGTNSIYFDPPEGQQIRAHLFAPRKYIFGNYFNTYWVNIGVILLMTVVLHVLLYFRAAENFVNRLGSISLFAKYFEKD